MKLFAYLFIIIALVFSVAGCAINQFDDNGSEPVKPEEPISESPIAEEPQEVLAETAEALEPQVNEVETQVNDPEERAKISVKLFFGDKEAMGFNLEERFVEQLTPEILINELILGPAIPENIKTIPEGTQLLGITIENEVAYVNFSREIVDNHWGGSAGEFMTLGSIANTLAMNETLGITEVQILVEGEVIETLAGHFDTSIPIKPNDR